MQDYLRDPAAIYRQSFAIIADEARLERLPPDLQPVAMRLIHACGMVDLAEDLVFSADVVAAAKTALADGRPVLTDSTMVAAGIATHRLPASNPVICRVSEPATATLAMTLGTTRSAAAVDLWRCDLAGAVVAIGNAPTALFRLLERLDEGAPPPAAILAFPVGFVGAAESKAALARNPRGVPFLTLAGRRGGSPLASAAVNAIAFGTEAP